MNRLLIHIIIGVGLLLSGLNSCAPQPPTLVPWFDLRDPKVSATSCRLVAYVPEDVSGDYSMGFYFGKSPEEMEKYPSDSPYNPVVLSVNIHYLQSNTEYFYKAYAGNGHNEVCSEIRSLKTKPL